MDGDEGDVTVPPGDDWRLIREELRDGASQMAFDEVAARTAADGGPRTVRVYQWLPSTLSLGYRQDSETVDWDYCEEYGVDVVRRPTGGGGIYHDTYGDIAYSIIAPADEVPGDLLETYRRFCEPLFAAFDEMGVDARFVEREVEALYEPACYLRAMDPAHDVVAGDGRKLAGNAQYRRQDAVVQHGSITYHVDAEQHLAVFDDPGITAEAFHDRVTGLDEQATSARENPDWSSEEVGPMDSFDFVRAYAVRTLEESLMTWAGAEEGDWTDDERTLAEERAEAKYRSDAWTLDRDDPTD